MICDDSTCQILQTCKWDSGVAGPYCGNMYTPSSEPDSDDATVDTVPREQLIAQIEALQKVVHEIRDERTQKNAEYEYRSRNNYSERRSSEGGVGAKRNPHSSTGS